MERIKRISIGTIFFIASFLVYNALFKEGFEIPEIIVLSLVNSIGIEFIIPVFHKKESITILTSHACCSMIPSYFQTVKSN